MFVKHCGKRPVIHKLAAIEPGAIVSGDVTIGPHTVVLAGAVITSQGAPVRIGEKCIIMENAVIRGAGKHSCIIENHVLIGPHAHISGATIKGKCFIATGAAIFNGSILEEGTVVTVNGIVHIAAHCPPSTFVPIGHIAFGDPTTIYSPEKAPAFHKKLSSIGFTKMVFSFDSSDMTNAEANYALCEKYTRALSKHKNDEIIK